MGSATGVRLSAARRLGVSMEEYDGRQARGEKWCTGCKAWHPFAAFGRDMARSDGLAASCLSARKRRYDAVRPDRRSSASPVVERPDINTECATAPARASAPKRNGPLPILARSGDKKPDHLRVRQTPNSPERQDSAARSGMTPTTGAGATSSARAAQPPCGSARAQGPTGDAGDASNTGGGAHGSPPALSSEHVHRFKVTPITTRREPFLRCECGAWTGKARNERGEPPYSASMAKGLESRLAKAGPDAPSSAPWPDNALAQRWPAATEITPAVDEVLARRPR